MKTKALSKKLVLNKQTVSALSFENLQNVKGGAIITTTLNGLTMCPVLTCGKIYCEMTRYPDMYC